MDAPIRIGRFSPFGDVRFLPLLLFGCWFAVVNGITQSAQQYFPLHILGFSLLVARSLETGMRVGQWAISPWLGTLADRWGNRPVMFVCQLLVAVGMVFFAVASPSHRQWITGAWVCWIAYAGLNIGLPNWLLKIAPRGRKIRPISPRSTPPAECVTPPAPSSAERWSTPAGAILGLGRRRRRLFCRVVSLRLDRAGTTMAEACFGSPSLRPDRKNKREGTKGAKTPFVPSASLAYSLIRKSWPNRERRPLCREAALRGEP